MACVSVMYAGVRWDAVEGFAKPVSPRASANNTLPASNATSPGTMPPAKNAMKSRRTMTSSSKTLRTWRRVMRRHVGGGAGIRPMTCACSYYRTRSARCITRWLRSKVTSPSPWHYAPFRYSRFPCGLYSFSSQVWWASGLACLWYGK